MIFYWLQLSLINFLPKCIKLGRMVDSKLGRMVESLNKHNSSKHTNFFESIGSKRYFDLFSVSTDGYITKVVL